MRARCDRVKLFRVGLDNGLPECCAVRGVQEFMEFMLKQMGYIEPQIIQMINECYDELDEAP